MGFALSSSFKPMPPNFSAGDRDRFRGYAGRQGPNGCSPWTGCTVRTTDQFGLVKDVRGIFRLAGQTYYAHRVAYFFECGADPGPALVIHECNKSLCVNADHLFLGNDSDNMRHRADSGRQPVGSFSGNAGLDETDIPVIWRRLAAGESLASVARAFGVSKAAINFIKQRVTWKHVP